MRRLPALVVVFGALLAGLVGQAITDPPAPAPAPDALSRLLQGEFPVAAPDQSRDGTWYCAGGTSDEAAFADHSVIIVNPSDVAATATMTVVAGRVLPAPVSVADALLDTTTGATVPAGDDTVSEKMPEPVVRVVDLAPAGRTVIRLADVIAAPITSALVESSDGRIAVFHEVRSVHGIGHAACTTTTSSTWHLAYGTTVREARELLVLFNPFTGDAVADLQFSTEDGVREPVGLQGIVVPGRTSLAIDVGDFVTRRREVSATVATRTGRLVVDRIVRLDEDAATRGLTLAAGVPRPLLDWVFPAGRVGEDISEKVVVYNPGEAVAEASVEIILDDPERNGIPAPFEVSIPPGAHQVIDVSADGRVPADVGHSMVVRSENGVPVVADRLIGMTQENRAGLSVSGGSPVESAEWRLAGPAIDEATQLVVTVLNLDPLVLAEVDLFAVGDGQVRPIGSLSDVVIEAGTQVSWELSPADVGDGALVVVSSEPVIVELSIHVVDAEGRGVSHSLGVPVTSALRLPSSAELPDGTDLSDVDSLEDELQVDLDVPVPPSDVELPDVGTDPGSASTSTTPASTSTSTTPGSTSTASTDGG